MDLGGSSPAILPRAARSDAKAVFSRFRIFNVLRDLITWGWVSMKRSTSSYPIRLIERQVEFLQRMVDDLFESVRASAGKVELRRQRLLLQDVITAAVDDALPRLQQHSHKLQAPRRVRS